MKLSSTFASTFHLSTYTYDYLVPLLLNQCHLERCVKLRLPPFALLDCLYREVSASLFCNRVVLSGQQALKDSACL